MIEYIATVSGLHVMHFVYASPCQVIVCKKLQLGSAMCTINQVCPPTCGKEAFVHLEVDHRSKV